MAAEQELLIKVAADTGKAIQEINRLNKQVTKLEKSNKKVGATSSDVDKLAKSYHSLSGVVKTIGVGLAALGVTTEAIDFAKLAASAQQADDAFTSAVTDMGGNAEVEFAKIKAASKGLIPEAEIKQAVVSAMSLGVPLDNMSQLMEIARAKAREMGTDTGKAFADLALGISRGSPQILDNLGLTIKLGDANQKMADQIGKTVDQLTKKEKTQALLNAVVEQGQKSVERYASSELTAAQKMQKFNATMEDLKVKIGSALLPALLDAQAAITDWLGSLSASDIDKFTSNLGSLANTVVTVGKAMAALNDIAVPDWLAGDGATLLGTVADGWGKIATALDMAANGTDNLYAALNSAGTVMASTTATEKDTVDTLREKNKTIADTTEKLGQMIVEYSKVTGTGKHIAALKTVIAELQGQQKANLETMRQMAAEKPFDNEKQSADSAKESIKALTDEHQKLLDKEKEAAQARLTTADSTLAQLYAKETDLKNKIAALEAEKAAIRLKYANIRANTERDYQNFVSDARQKGMSDYQRYLDNQNRAAKALADAKTAYAQGNFEQAKTLLDEYDALIQKSAGDEIRQGENVVVSRSATLQQFQSQYKAAADVRLGLINQEEAREIAASNAKIAAKQAELQATLAQIEAQRQIIQLYQQIVAAATGAKFDVDFSSVDASIKNIKKQIADLENQKKKIPIDADTEKAESKIDKTKKDAEKNGAELKVDADTTEAKKKIDVIHTYMETGASYRIDADTSEADAKIAATRKTAEDRVTTPQDLDNTSAVSKEQAFRRQASTDIVTHQYIYQHVVPPAASGGLIQYFASGGYAKRFDTGGRVSGAGTSTSDSIPAMLSNGEYVIRAAAVRKMGVGFLDMINRMQLDTMKLASGGSVSQSAPAQTNAAGHFGTLDINIGGTPIGTVMTDREVAEALQRHLESEAGL